MTRKYLDLIRVSHRLEDCQLWSVGRLVTTMEDWLVRGSDGNSGHPAMRCDMRTCCIISEYFLLILWDLINIHKVIGSGLPWRDCFEYAWLTSNRFDSWI